MAKTEAHAANNLTAEVRTKTGKGASRQARRDGKVPAVLYGHGADPQHLVLPAREFSAVLRNSGTNAVLTLDIDGKKRWRCPRRSRSTRSAATSSTSTCIIVRRGEKVTVEVNVVVEGDAGPDTLVNQEANTIEIESDAMSIPEHLTLSVEGAVAGTQFTAAQSPLPDGVTLISDPELLVVNVIPAPTGRGPRSRGCGERRCGRSAQAEESAEAATPRPSPEPVRVGADPHHGRTAAGGRPGQPRTAVRHHPAQPRLPGRRHPGRSHRLGVQGAQEVRRRGGRRAGSAAGRWCWPSRGPT